MSDRDPEEVVRLVTAPNPAAAHIWEQALKANGIDCKVVGDYMDAGLGDIPGMRSELWVHRNDVAAAEEILRNTQGAVDEETETAGG